LSENAVINKDKGNCVKVNTIDKQIKKRSKWFHPSYPFIPGA